MNIFEILGPVMVGPSSSHTAGAVRIGYISRQLLGSRLRTPPWDCTAPFGSPAAATARPWH